MTISETRGEDSIQLVVEGNVDTNTAPQLQTRILLAFQKGKTVVLEMSKCPYMSSAGLRALLRTGKKAKKTKKQFVFCGVAGMVKEILEDSGTDLLFQIYESAADLQ